jgi:hypothetical protein
MFLPILLGGSVFVHADAGTTAVNERVQSVQQDISKWDKNHDGVLTGTERDDFIKAKRKSLSENS